jgi:hypothetical protein
VPIAAAVLAAPGAVRIWPVRGSTALRALPEQTVAWRACCSGRKFDAWPS